MCCWGSSRRLERWNLGPSSLPPLRRLDCLWSSLWGWKRVMNRKTWFMMFFSFTGSKFSFEPLGLAEGSGCTLTVVPPHSWLMGSTQSQGHCCFTSQCHQNKNDTRQKQRSGASVRRPVLSRHSRCFFQCPLISRTRASLSAAEL